MSENVETSNVPADLDAICFVAQSLFPFWLEDPQKGNAGELFAAFANLDAQAAGQEWPFVDDETAQECLGLMAEGLANGTDVALTREYRRLLVGPARRPAPPWGSVYTDRECVIYGATTLELRAWMRANGLESHFTERMPEDHIGLMLALLSFIAENRPELTDEFLQLHLLTWSSHFLEQEAAAAEHPFYKGLSLLTKATLEGIQAEHGISVEYPRYYR